MATILNRLDALKRPPVDGGPSICLCMIVRNEAHVIRRCLASVKPVIKSWCIVDTGSTDGTQDAIREELSGIPGELHEREWVDFATARNQAMDLAPECDYLMVIDADEVLKCDPLRVALRDDVYKINVKYGASVNPRVWLIRKGYAGRWVGAIHEDLRKVGSWAEVRGPWIESFPDGARSKNPNKHNEDLKVLFAEIQRDPKNPRNYYYLGMTYLAAGDIAQAEKALDMRVKFKGDPGELSRAKQILSSLHVNAVLATIQR